MAAQIKDSLLRSYLVHKMYYFGMPLHLQHPQAEWTSHVNFGAFYSFTRKRSRVPKNQFQLFYSYFQSLNNALQKKSKLHQLFKSLLKTLNFCHFHYHFITIYISSSDGHSFWSYLHSFYYRMTNYITLIAEFLTHLSVRSVFKNSTTNSILNFPLSLYG